MGEDSKGGGEQGKKRVEELRHLLALYPLYPDPTSNLQHHKWFPRHHQRLLLSTESGIVPEHCWVPYPVSPTQIKKKTWNNLRVSMH